VIADSVRAELDILAVTSTSPGLAAAAVKLAEAMDALQPGDAPTAQAVLADKLHALLVRLRALAPVQEEGDSVDDIARQREKRRAEARERAASE
jgi:hypothetical protein